MKAVIKLFIVGCLHLYRGSITPVYSTAKPTQTHHIEVRRPAEEKISKYQSDRDFNYEESKHEHSNLWQRFTDWLTRLLTPKSFNPNIGSPNILLGIIEFLVIGAAVALFVYFILKSQGSSLFSKNNASNFGLTESHEDISQMNFDELIAKTAGSGQYRQAVRYLYLKSLKQLSDLDLIKWKADKTNRDYTIELHSSPFSTLFSEITLLFDYAWYGNAAINENTFSRIKSTFEKFNLSSRTKDLKTSEKIYVAILLLIFAILGVVEYNTPLPVNWEESFSKIDKIPYGEYAVYDILQDIFSGKENYFFRISTIRIIGRFSH